MPSAIWWTIRLRVMLLSTCLTPTVSFGPGLGLPTTTTCRLVASSFSG